MDADKVSPDIVDAVMAFVNAPDNRLRRSLIEQRWKELNTDDADRVVTRLIGTYGDDEESVSYLRNMRYLLYRCRNEGVRRAFETPPPNFPHDVQQAVHEFVNANASDEAREVYTSFSKLLLSQEADRILDFMELFFGDDSRLRGRIEERKQQLQKCHKGAIEDAFPPDKLEVPQHIVDAIDEFVNAPDWSQKTRVLRARQKELLSEEADAFLGFITSLKEVSEDPMIKVLNWHRSTLERCRREGVEVVIGTASESELPAAQPDELAQKELEEELRRLSEGRNIFHENQIEDLLRRRPELRGAWEAYSRHTVPIADEDSGRRQLAVILGELSNPSESKDFRRRIELLRNALSLPLTRQLPELWATLQQSLGAALSQCPDENRDELIEEALEHHRLALTVFGAETRPLERAANLLDMGNAYSQRPGGNRSENLEEAIRCYEEGAELHRRVEGRVPPGVYLNLGNVYIGRVKGNRHDNIERSIKYLTLATEHSDPAKSPIEWADAKLNLGNALLSHLGGDRADNIERAISSYHDAYKVYSTVPHSDRLGLYHMGMMDAYLNRVVGSKKSNYQQSLHHAQEALRTLPRDSWPEKWAEANNRLGYLLYEDAAKEDDILKAIECFERALDVYDRTHYPTDWAKMQVNMGAALARLSGREGFTEKAIACYSSALEVYTRHSFPERWSSIHHNLGQLFLSLRPLSDDATSKAVEHFRLALEARPTDLLPRLAFETNSSLAWIYSLREDWELTHTSLHEALSAARNIFSSSYTDEGRRFELGKVTGLYALDAFSLLRLGRKGEALGQLDEGKTRLLAEAMALSDVEVSVLSEADYSELRSARDIVRQAESNLSLSESNADTTQGAEGEKLRAARRHLSQVISSIRSRNPKFQPAGLSPEALSALIPTGGAIVAPYVTPYGGGAFILPHGETNVANEHVLEIHDLNTHALRYLLFGRNGDGGSAGWLEGYMSLRSGRSLSAWQSVLLDVTGTLWDLLMARVSSRLLELGVGKGSPIILMPQGGLGVLPLHAAWYEDQGGRRYFSDDYVVSYAPSGYALDVSHRRNRIRDYKHSLLAVVNPTLDLPFASDEGDEVFTAFQSYSKVRLKGEEASPEAVLEAVAGKSYIHFACHGSYDWLEPMASSLYLAGGQELRLVDVIRRMNLQSCRLVVLSACETGLSEFQRIPDEFLGLPAGFLQAGAPAVISSLWPVSDLSTMLLMKHFYEGHLGENLPPAEALHRAQRWLCNATNQELSDLFRKLRDSASDKSRMSFAEARTQFQRYTLNPDQNERPFNNPHYWAAFTLTGA